MAKTGDNPTGLIIVTQSTIDHLIASKQPNVLSKLMSGEWDKRELDKDNPTGLFNGIKYYVGI